MIYPKEHWLTDDEHGIQMPWYTRPCLEVMDKWDFVDKDIYEYGVGYSTIWYGSRGALCSGVDINQEWVNFTKEGCVNWRPNKAPYIRDISHGCALNGYDIVAIDGNFRDDCTEYALQYLKPGGKLILDNWLQPEVEEFWPKTEALIKGMPIEVYKEPTHPHWKTAIVTV